jgi:O-antigen ligase
VLGPAAVVLVLVVAGVTVGLGLAAIGEAGGAGLAALVVGLTVVTVTVARRPLWACGLVFACTAIGNRPLPAVPLGLQIVHGVCVLALGAVLFSVVGGAPADRLGRPELRLPLLFGAALVLGAILSTATSIDPAKSSKVAATLATGLLITVAVIVVGRTGRQLRILLAIAALGSLLVTLPALAGARDLTAVYGGTIVKNRPTTAFADPNELGSYAAMSFLLALGWLIAAGGRRQRAVAATAALASAAALALSLSRGAWLGAAIGLVILVVIHPRARRPIGWVALAGVTATLAALLLLSASGPVEVVLNRVTSVSNPEGNPYDVRPITWQEALREFSERPVIGNGPGSFSVLSAQSPSELQFYPRMHAHNGLLTVAAEMGSFGALSLIGLAVTLVIAVRGRARRLRAAQRWEDLGVLAGGAAALGALSGHLLVDYPLRNPVLMVTVWAVVGVVLAATAIPAAPRRGARTVTVYAAGQR